jgi:hypothetical protein
MKRVTYISNISSRFKSRPASSSSPPPFAAEIAEADLVADLTPKEAGANAEAEVARARIAIEIFILLY